MACGAISLSINEFKQKMAKFIYLTKVSFLIKLFSKNVIFIIESCKKVSDNFGFKMKKLILTKGLLFSLRSVNVTFHSVFLITLVISWSRGQI